jgi:hypothetical protein
LRQDDDDNFVLKIMRSEEAKNSAKRRAQRRCPNCAAGTLADRKLEGYKPRATTVMRSWKSCRRVCSSQDSCQGIEGKNFDMISWFSQSPAFAAAWSPHRRQPGIENFDVYQRIP